MHPRAHAPTRIKSKLRGRHNPTHLGLPHCTGAGKEWAASESRRRLQTKCALAATTCGTPPHTRSSEQSSTPEGAKSERLRLSAWQISLSCVSEGPCVRARPHAPARACVRACVRARVRQVERLRARAVRCEAAEQQQLRHERLAAARRRRVDEVCTAEHAYNRPSPGATHSSQPHACAFGGRARRREGMWAWGATLRACARGVGNGGQTAAPVAV
eukprot:6189541-Pleurochrysis_carterae.AAC.2